MIQLPFQHPFKNKHLKGARYLLLLLILLLGGNFLAEASHIRAGEITARRISGTALTYEFTLTIYTDSTSPVENPEGTLFFGDGNSQTVNRQRPFPILGNRTWVNRYIFNHTYSGARTYTVYYWEQNRNNGVLNMDRSDLTTFYIETQLVIDPNIPPNNTPVLTVPPVDLACTRQRWYHNPGASDADGDSLSYEFIPSKQWDMNEGRVKDVENFRMPETVFPGQNFDGNAPAGLTLSRRGEIVWDVPAQQGQYNLAFKITEWRRIRGRMVPIGYVVRDMQILVGDCRNRQPELEIPEDTCIEARRTWIDTVFASDPDQFDRLNIQAYGQPFLLPTERQPFFPEIENGVNPTQALISWTPNCLEVRTQPYDITYRVEDVPITTSKMAVLKTQQLRVLGPAPINLTTDAGLGEITVRWANYRNTVCPNASAIQIWRKTDSSNYQKSACKEGLGPEDNFELLGTVDANTTSFLDDNRGQKLDPAKIYCYRIVAVFPQPSGGLSYASEEVCTRLRIQMPVITNVSVTKTGRDTGEVFVRWTTPLELDTQVYRPPYEYRLFRKLAGNNPLQEVFRSNNILDTTFTERNLNTEENIYQYRIAFYYSPQVNLLDTSGIAATPRLRASSDSSTITLRWRWDNVPWTNTSERHFIYRRKEGPFQLIDSVLIGFGDTVGTYLDEGQFNNEPLIKNEPYEYYITTVGKYGDTLLPRPLLNNSQIIFARTRDSIPPCAPTLIVTQPSCDDCKTYPVAELRKNRLSWRNPISARCDTDLVGYNIYYARYESDTPVKIATTTDTTFEHSDAGSLAGCYFVTAIDFSQNESEPSNKVCVDNCYFFEMPNVFLPDGDGRNEVFQPICALSELLSDFNIKVFNRYGGLVYEAQSFERPWNGTDNNGHSLGDGLYYYLISGNYKRLSKQDELLRWKGWVQILRVANGRGN